MLSHLLMLSHFSPDAAKVDPPCMDGANSDDDSSNEIPGIGHAHGVVVEVVQVTYDGRVHELVIR